MIQNKLYIWKLASFINNNKMKMSGEELANHLNRNDFLTSYGSEYEGGRGTYRLIKETYWWAHDIIGKDEAAKIAEAFVKPDGSYAYQE